MQSLWSDEEARQFSEQGGVGLRVYTSQLLGRNPDLVLHGGGNTSVKGSSVNSFGESSASLFVKGSGWDLRTIEAAGFPATDLDYLLRLGTLDTLSDTAMMKELRLALREPNAPTPSVEAILHALIPHKFVDHSHSDAVVAISNTPNGEEKLAQIYGERVLILPYLMPGFVLAKQVAEATAQLDWSSIDGVVLAHHGIFTFAEDARTSYENMIRLVSKAEDYLLRAGAEQSIVRGSYSPSAEDALRLAALRQQAGKLLGHPPLLRLDSSAEASGFAQQDNADALIAIGPLTPDHTIHAKAFGAVFEDDPCSGLETFVSRYQQYFDEHRRPEHQCLDTMPRYGVWRDKGMVYLAANSKRLDIVADISAHTIKAIQWGEALGGWRALPRQDLFDVEYWELEQAKLKKGGSRAELEGKVALVTGAASGIGRACVAAFLAEGAAVIALDIDASVEESNANSAVYAARCDVSDKAAVAEAITQGVLMFGGIDIIVSNAGSFPESQQLAEQEDELWDKSLELNLSSHMRLLRSCLPYLKVGFDPAVVFVASKNVPAPGPGAAAYSSAKAGLTQMARVAALELGAAGIRVNIVHPNAVYDTGIWTDEVLASRAAHYGLSIEEYKTRNVLGTEVTSQDVARAVCLFAGTSLGKTTGAQLPVDGGNDRVI